MADIEQLLERYKAAHRESGDADPRPFLAEVTGTDRAELAAHIDQFLAHADAPPFDADAFARFRADPAREALVASVLDDATLSDLVAASGVGRKELSRRLASEFGIPGTEPQIRGRLRDLENGDVDANRVKPQLWAALGRLLSVSAERVRTVTENAIGLNPGASAAGFARPQGVGSTFSLMIPGDPNETGDDARRRELVDEAFFD